MHLLERVSDRLPAGVRRRLATVADKLGGEDERRPAADRAGEGEEGVAPASPQQARVLAEHIPGGEAETPLQVPRAGWVAILKRAWKESSSDQVPLMAAGVAFYAFLSIFPALIAVILVYGLVADQSTVTAQVESLSSSLPRSASTLLQDQLSSLVSAKSSSLGWGLVGSVAVALWSASNGVTNLMKAVSTAYDEEESRSFLKLRGLGLLVTLGAIVFVVVAIALLAVAPAVLAHLPLSGFLLALVQVLRWVVLLVAFTAGLAVVYRVAPDRESPRMSWVSVGAVVATVLWVVVSVGFTVYANLGGYGSTYGSLAGVVVLLFWLWLSAYAVLLGAEVNAEAEQQTRRDTTTGPERPMGQRRAYKADTLPERADAGADPTTA